MTLGAFIKPAAVRANLLNGIAFTRSGGVNRVLMICFFTLKVKVGRGYHVFQLLGRKSFLEKFPDGKIALVRGVVKGWKLKLWTTLLRLEGAYITGNTSTEYLSMSDSFVPYQLSIGSNRIKV